MKTIAISIEEGMLDSLRRLADVPGEAGRGNRRRRRSISELVREALRDYLGRSERRLREEKDRLALARHRKRLRKEAEALIGEQAKP